ncbi:hypothetical protein [Bacillus thuringiensis]|uniref:hypothetical protein n=1 Tax=Bacillus thuringiensis TaxID=1428 RepID=UPI001E560916|nr:hypothetical protein [Bacillus thuringiensis]
MHFAFVPVVYANKVVSKKDLQSFHGDLDAFLKAEFSHIYQGGILNDKTIGIDTVKD